MKILAILGFAAILAGCDAAVMDEMQPNQCLRAEIFKQCMAILPSGPVATKYNDWNEVVSECGSQGYYQSMRKTSTIPMECRAR
ncbi:hypothetical protein D3C87_323690 [compost metagenome]